MDRTKQTGLFMLVAGIVLVVGGFLNWKIIYASSDNIGDSSYYTESGRKVRRVLTVIVGLGAIGLGVFTLLFLPVQ